VGLVGFFFFFFFFVFVFRERAVVGTTVFEADSLNMADLSPRHECASRDIRHVKTHPLTKHGSTVNSSATVLFYFSPDGGFGV